ncbi:MAG: conserved hypothetical protein [Marine Group I thaumarchaeote]|nr:MAG: conserved hypothetical protein [Marine Group I thaumarchaeote]
MLGSLETGKSLDGLNLKINQIKRDLSQLEESNKPMPELINSTNLLRSNEILTKTNEKKTELLNAYESYFKDLESVLKKIQTGFNILKTTPKKKTRKKRTRKKKKTKRKNKRRKKTRTRKKSRKRKPSKRKR